jgi:uncharacterized protein
MTEDGSERGVRPTPGRPRPGRPRPGRARDEDGRPRNDRPRDRLGRPLPPGSAGVEPVPDELDLGPDDALDYAQRLLDEGRAFGAHEVLEAVWKAAPPTERELWRSLAQLAVGVTHLERGNPAGARALLERGTAGLGPFRRTPPHGIAVDRLISQGRAVVEELATGGTPAVPVLRLRDGPA